MELAIRSKDLRKRLYFNAPNLVNQNNKSSLLLRRRWIVRRNNRIVLQIPVDRRGIYHQPLQVLKLLPDLNRIVNHFLQSYLPYNRCSLLQRRPDYFPILLSSFFTGI